VSRWTDVLADLAPLVFSVFNCKREGSVDPSEFGGFTLYVLDGDAPSDGVTPVRDRGWQVVRVRPESSFTYAPEVKCGEIVVYGVVFSLDDERCAAEIVKPWLHFINQDFLAFVPDTLARSAFVQGLLNDGEIAEGIALPDFVWRVEVDDESLPPGFIIGRGCGKVDFWHTRFRYVHLRRVHLPRGDLDSLVRALHGVAGVALGLNDRDDADHFLPASGVGPGWLRDPTSWLQEAVHRSPMSNLGWPMRRFGDPQVVAAIELLEPGARLELGDRDLALVRGDCNAEDAIPAGKRWHIFDLVEKKYVAEKLKNGARVELVLKDCADADWVEQCWPFLHDAFLCLCVGSMSRPRGLKSALADLALPWPGSERRESVRCYIKSESERLEGLHTRLHDLAQEAGELESHFRQIGIGAGDPLTRGKFDSRKSKLEHEIGQLGGHLQNRSIRATANTPGLLGMQMKAVGARSNEPIAHLNLLICLAESVVRYEAICRAAVLGRRSPDVLSQILTRMLKDGGWCRTTFGHWMSLSREAAAAIPGDEPAKNRLLSGAEEKKWQKSAQEIVEIRNKIAHGGPTSRATAEKQRHEVAERLPGMLKLAPPERWGPLRRWGSLRPRGRGKLFVESVLLTGDNPIFENDELPTACLHSIQDLAESDVVIEPAPGDWVQVSPWIVYDWNTRLPGFWWVDHFSRYEGRYRKVSPSDSDVHSLQSCRELDDAVARLFG